MNSFELKIREKNKINELNKLRKINKISKFIGFDNYYLLSKYEYENNNFNKNDDNIIINTETVYEENIPGKARNPRRLINDKLTKIKFYKKTELLEFYKNNIKKLNKQYKNEIIDSMKKFLICKLDFEFKNELEKYVFLKKLKFDKYKIKHFNKLNKKYINNNKYDFINNFINNIYLDNYLIYNEDDEINEDDEDFLNYNHYSSFLSKNLNILFYDWNYLKKIGVYWKVIFSYISIIKTNINKFNNDDFKICFNVYSLISPSKIKKYIKNICFDCNKYINNDNDNDNYSLDNNDSYYKIICYECDNYNDDYYDDYSNGYYDDYRHNRYDCDDGYFSESNRWQREMDNEDALRRQAD